MSIKRLYVYYLNNDEQVKLENFRKFNELLDWCNANCTKNGDEFFFNGNKVLCSYHLSLTTSATQHQSNMQERNDVNET